MKKYVIPVIHLMYAIFMLLCINNAIKVSSGFMFVIIFIYFVFAMTLFIKTISKKNKK